MNLELGPKASEIYVRHRNLILSCNSRFDFLVAQIDGKIRIIDDRLKSLSTLFRPIYRRFGLLHVFLWSFVLAALASVAVVGHAGFFLLLFPVAIWFLAHWLDTVLFRRVKPRFDHVESLLLARKTGLSANNEGLSKTRESWMAIRDENYRKACSLLVGEYPPDWDQRIRDVKNRDHHCCVMCGYPKGVKSRRRELQVHHIRPLRSGGNNKLENLVTLCHICHGKAHHRKIKRMKPKRRSYRRRR